MNKEELKKRYDVILDAWQLLKKYSNVLDTEEYWESVIEEGHLIAAKYGKTEFAITILSEVICELGRTAKGDVGSGMDRQRNA